LTLELLGISKTVDDEPWLTGIDLVLDEGLNVLVGPTRAGKTTLMRIAAGLEQPTEGRIVEDGEDVTGRSLRRRDVAFVYQEFVNYPSLTVQENVAAPLRRRGGLSRAEIAERVGEVVELMQLQPYVRRRPAELSGGQQQRVAIARALVKETRLLVLDEPLANLDYKLREELRGELERIFTTRSSVILYSTSEPLEALTLGGRTVVMDEGRVLQSGPAVEAYHGPRSSQVARIFSDPPMNLLTAEVTGGQLRLPGGVAGPRPRHFEPVGDGPVTVGLRPHLLALEASSEDAIAVGGNLLLAELTGSATYLHIQLGELGEALVAEVPGVHSHPLGERLQVFIRPESLFAFDEASGDLLAKPPIAAESVETTAGIAGVADG
jgi:glycerol transport system ATP-binding protein